MNGKLGGVTDFVTKHPFITVGAILVLDGWVTNILRLIDNRKKVEIIEGEFKEVKEKEPCNEKGTCD